MKTYAVMFQKGWRVGTRALRIEYPEAETETEAIKKAKAMFPEAKAQGYRLYKVREA